MASPIYQGQFGEFTITKDDRTGVIVYRAGLMVAALSFAFGSVAVLLNNNSLMLALTPLYACFSLALGVSLFTIHIYLAPLHRLLQIFWAIGSIVAVALVLSHSDPLAVTVYNQPTTLYGIGFTFAAMNGIFFKEAFCFNRVETKVLVFAIPLLLLGHLFGIFPTEWERVLLGLSAFLFVVFALRKSVQAIPDDIGDKSVFAYLATQRSASA